MTAQKVECRHLGKCGLKVSVPIIGGATFGSVKYAGFSLGEEESLPILKAAWDSGINTVDTANIYSDGGSERIIGAFLKKYDIPRHKIIIMSKCYGHLSEDTEMKEKADPTKRDYVNQGGLSRPAIFNAIEASLKRLNTPYIDLYQIHRFDPNTPIEETMKALHDLVQSGKARYIGASSMRAWQFSEMNHVAETHGWTKFVTMQSEYSLLYREDEREMNPYCNAHGIGLIPWSPLAGGMLARPYNSPPTKRSAALKGTPLETPNTEADIKIVGRVEEIAKKRGWTMAQVGLAWVAAKTASPIPGIASIQRLEGTLIKDKTLTEEEVKYLEEPYVPKPIRGHL